MPDQRLPWCAGLTRYLAVQRMTGCPCCRNMAMMRGGMDGGQQAPQSQPQQHDNMPGMGQPKSKMAAPTILVRANQPGGFRWRVILDGDCRQRRRPYRVCRARSGQ